MGDRRLSSADYFTSNSQHTIATNSYHYASTGPGSMQAVDMDGDGDIDIVAFSSSYQLAWYENDGSQVYTQHIVSSDLI